MEPQRETSLPHVTSACDRVPTGCNVKNACNLLKVVVCHTKKVVLFGTQTEMRVLCVLRLGFVHGYTRRCLCKALAALV